MSPGILFALMLYSKIICLCDANKLAIVAPAKQKSFLFFYIIPSINLYKSKEESHKLCSHNSAMQQPLHSRQNTKAISKTELFNLAIAVLNLNSAIDQHAPTVEFLAVIQDHHTGTIDDRKYHYSAQRSSDSQSHVCENSKSVSMSSSVLSTGSFSKHSRTGSRTVKL